MTRTLLLSFLLCQNAPDPRFEVASIKPSNPDQLRGPSGITTGHGRIAGNNVTLKRCIMGAYGLGPHQISGGPPWLDSDRFEIAAKSEEPNDGDEVLMTMLRTLMAERFKLSVHRETRTVRALLLEVAKSGPKLENAEQGEAATRSFHGAIDASMITMTRFAEVLSRATELPVVDRTGLKGAFNLKLRWRPESPWPTVTGVDDAMERPPLSTALEQQLGLHLESRKVPMEILVIDHAEKPTDN